MCFVCFRPGDSGQRSNSPVLLPGARGEVPGEAWPGRLNKYTDISSNEVA